MHTDNLDRVLSYSQHCMDIYLYTKQKYRPSMLGYVVSGVTQDDFELVW